MLKSNEWQSIPGVNMLKFEFKKNEAVQEIDFENNGEVEITVKVDSQEFKDLFCDFTRQEVIDILFIRVTENYTKYLVVDAINRTGENGILLTTFFLKEIK